MKFQATAFGIAAALLVSEPSWACRHNAPTEHRIRTLAADVVVLAEVDFAGYTGPRDGDWHEWKGWAVTKRTLRGEIAQRGWEFGRTLGAQECATTV
jgi:hypothetical protein